MYNFDSTLSKDSNMSYMHVSIYIMHYNSTQKKMIYIVTRNRALVFSKTCALFTISSDMHPYACNLHVGHRYRTLSGLYRYVIHSCAVSYPDPQLCRLQVHNLTQCMGCRRNSLRQFPSYDNFVLVCIFC